MLTVRLCLHNWLKSYLIQLWSSLSVPQLPQTNCLTAAYNTIVQAAHKHCTPVLHPQLCHELQIYALPHGQFMLHWVNIFLQEVHQLAQWVGSPCQSLYWAAQTIDLTASQLPFPAASCLPLLMSQEWDMHSVVSAYFSDIWCQRSTPQAVSHNSYQSTVTLPYWAAGSNFIRFHKQGLVSNNWYKSSDNDLRYLCMKQKHMGWRSRACLTLHLGIRWGWLVSFLSQHLCHCYPLCRWLGRPHHQSGCVEQETNSCPFQESNCDSSVQPTA